MRRWVPWWALVLLFIVLPVVEIYLLIQLGQAIGAWWTVLLLVADGVLGGYLMKHEGRRAWRALNEALEQRRMPATELADGALILVGGTLLLTPGFISDIAGFFLVLPFTRPVARKVLARYLTRKFLDGGNGGQGGQGGPTTRQRPGPDSVVQGEVVD